MATSKELLTNLADELRTLTNTTDKMGLSVMAGHVSDANTEVDEQSAVVDELMAALQGKSVPGGSGGSVETCTVTVNCLNTMKVYLDLVCHIENGNIVYKSHRNGSVITYGNEDTPITLNNVVCGSPIVLVAVGGHTPIIEHTTNITKMNARAGIYILLAPVTVDAAGSIEIDEYS